MDNFRLIPVESDEKLTYYWPYVRFGLNKILERNPDSWMPEDVYHDIKLKNSVLIMGMDVSLVGFVVISMRNGYDGKEGHVWVCYNTGGRKYLRIAWPKILRFCEMAGCRRVTMSSSRPGWKQLAVQLDLAPGHMQYSFNFKG